MNGWICWFGLKHGCVEGLLMWHKSMEKSEQVAAVCEEAVR